MKISRNIITPYITWTFVVLAFTGVLMLFHIFDGYTEVLHELTGLFFVIISIFHVIINWKALKIHFKKRAFVISIIVVFLLSIVTVNLGKGHGAMERIALEGLVKAPIQKTLEILHIDMDKAEEIFHINGIDMGQAKTIEEIGIKNQKSPKDLLELLVE